MAEAVLGPDGDLQSIAEPGISDGQTEANVCQEHTIALGLGGKGSGAWLWQQWRRRCSATARRDLRQWDHRGRRGMDAGLTKEAE